MMKKERISVNVWPSQKQLLARIAVARKTSISNVVFELIGGSEEALKRLVVILEAARKAELEYSSGFREMVSRGVEEVEEIYEDALDKLTNLEKETKKLKH